MPYHRRLAPALLLPLLLARCGSTEPIGPAPLTPAEVGGVYHICVLTFHAGGLQPVKVMEAVAEPEPGQGLPRPNLKLSLQVRQFELEYTPRGDVLPRRIPGSYTLDATTVTLDFGERAQNVLSNLLLPSPLHLRFEESPRALRVAARQASYEVPRADYARLKGLTAEETRNLRERIEGTVEAHLATGECGQE